MNLVETALDIAMDAHRGQTRKNSNMPYIIHPMRVADAIALDGMLTTVALLHDVLEDCPRERLVEFQSRINELGEWVGEEVSLLTRGDHDDKVVYMQSFMQKPIRSLIVKVFDRYDNVMDFMRHDKTYARIYARKAKPVYDAFYDRKKEFITFGGEDFWFRMYLMVDEMVGICVTPSPEPIHD